MASERKTLGSTAVQKKDQRCNQDLSGPIRSPSLPSRGALSRAATPGTEAIMPLIKATLLTLPASSRTYSVRMGIEPVATWMINVVQQAEYQFRVL